MGAGISHSPKTAYASSNVFTGEGDSIFEVAPDEQAFSIDFTTSLFNKLPKEVVKAFILPEQSTIIDIMTEPVAFTNASTPIEAWQEVIAPLFTGTDESKPYLHQILNALFKFLKERPMSFLEDEEQRQIGLREQRQTMYQNLQLQHRITRTPPIIITEEIDQSLQTIDDIMKFIPPMSSPEFIQHKSYITVTHRILKQMNDVQPGLCAIRWSIFVGDITPMITAFDYFLTLSLNKPRTNIKPVFPGFIENIPKLSLSNSCFVPIQTTRTGFTKLIDFKAPKTNSRSIMLCDGRFVYVLGSYISLTIVSLSKIVINNEIRFRQFEFEIPKKERIDTFIASSNGYLIIGGRFIENPQIYSLQPFTKTETNPSYQSSSMLRKSPKLVSPLACDGKFIYSLIKAKKIAVFSLDEKHIIFHKFIALIGGSCPLKEPFSQSLVPNKWTDEAQLYTNGCVISFLVLRNSDQHNRFDYFVRHFSLITGQHIGDVVFNLRWPIQSLSFDPWNQCVWALSLTSEDANLLKLGYFGPMPPWMTGLSYDKAKSALQICSMLENNKTPQSLAFGLIRFINLFMIHFTGSSFQTILYGQQYDVSIADFFAPCTADTILVLMVAINHLIEIYKGKHKTNDEWSTKKCSVSLLTLISLLQYNLSNFQVRLETNPELFPNQTKDQVIELFYQILDDDSLSFLHTTVAFATISSFETLFINRLEKCPTIFAAVVSKMDPDFILYAMQRINALKIFPYCMDPVSCKEIIDPIFEKMITSPLDLQKTNEFEFITLFQRTIMMEMRRIYIEYPAQLPPPQEQLQKTFFAYSTIITERMIFYIGNLVTDNSYFEAKIKFSPFFRLFRKWLMLLQPLSKFSRVSKTLIFLLHPLFSKFEGTISSLNINDILLPDGKGFVYIYSVFFELFSIYIDFISAYLDGGAELQNATSYSWLIRSTIESKITSKKIKKMEEILMEGNSAPDKRKRLLKRGVSFNVTDKDAVETSIILDFISNALLPEESHSIKILFDYLYKKVPDIMNKRLTDQDRHIERLVFLAYMKQLGFAAEVIDSNMKLISNEEPVLSHFVRGAMESVYRIRRNLKSSRQLSLQFQERLSTENSPLHPTRLQEDYQAYRQAIIDKCFFLIHIQPCIRYQQTDIDNAFPDIQKRIQVFICAEMTLDDCFKVISSAEAARKHISTGLQLINNILESNINRTCANFMLDRLAASESIMKYLSSLKVVSHDDNQNTGFSNVMKLLQLLSKMITEAEEEESLSNTMIVFYSNLVLTIGRMDIDSVFDPIINLFEQILGNKRADSKNMNSYIALLSSCLYALLSESQPNIRSLRFDKLKNILFPEDSMNASHLSIARLCLSIGMELPYTAESIISFLKTCPPMSYHPAFSFLLELIQRTPQKKKVFRWILKEISYICSGSQSSFMKDSPPLDKASILTTDKLVRTPGVLLGACSDLIQICRRTLITQTESAKSLREIIEFILIVNKKEDCEVPKKLRKFKDSLYLYGVFAILSNVIDTFRYYSMIKDTSNNTIFYVTEINMKENSYFGWQLPITGKSIPRHIPFSNEIVPISSMPFTTDIFDNYQLLIPYFQRALSTREASNKDEALDFYILSALIVYCGDHNFLTDFLKINLKFAINYITFENSANEFISLLRAHLSTNSIGFSLAQASSAHIMQCSQANIIPFDSSRITQNEIQTSQGVHTFISSVLNLNKPTYLEIPIPSNTAINVGIHCFSLFASTSVTYLYSSKLKQVFLNSSVVRTVTGSGKIESITISYNPMKKKVSILDGTTMNKIHSLVLPSNKACFVIHTFDKTRIQYHLSSIPIKTSSIDSSLAHFLCPVSGMTVFKRTRKQPMKLKEALKSPIIVSTKKVDFNSDLFAVPFTAMDDMHTNHIISESSSSTFISYPMTVLKACGHSLNTKQNKEMAIQSPQFTSYSIHLMSNASLTINESAYYELSDIPLSIVTKFVSKEETLAIDDSTGIMEIPETTGKPISLINPIHPKNYPILPTEIINFFSTGFVAKIRHETINQIFIRSMISSSLSMQELLKKYSMSINDLLEYALSLMLFIEPIHAQLINEAISPINFTTNILDPNQQSSSSKHLHRTALNKILEYMEQKENLETVVRIWYNLLIQQFADPQSHFVSKNHPHAIMFPLSALTEPRLVKVNGASALIVFKTGFSRNAQKMVVVEPQYANSQQISISNNIAMADGNSLLLTEANPKGNHSIVVVPMFPFSNESLFGSFFHLVVSFKNFIYFIIRHQDSIGLNEMHEYRIKVYQLFIDSFIAESPYFYYFGNDILKFLREQLPTTGNDFTDEMCVKLSLLAIYADTKTHPFISQFLEEQQMMWDERMLLPLKSFFPEFLTESDQRGIGSLDEITWGLPSPPLPDKLSSVNDYSQLAGQIKRMMKPWNSIVGYPFHLLLHVWYQYVSLYPPFEYTVISSNLVEVTFLYYVPKGPIDIVSSALDISVKYSIGTNSPNKIPKGKLFINMDGKDKLFIELEAGSWHNISFAFICPTNPTVIDDFIKEYRERFVSDVVLLVTKWDKRDDEKILNCFQLNQFSSPTISLSVKPELLLKSRIKYPLHILNIRCVLLFILNWMLYFDLISFENDPSLKCLCESMSMTLRMGRLQQLIDQQSNDDSHEITINRKEAYEVRTGSSDKLGMTIIAQLAEAYNEPRNFRRRGDKPWRISLIGENGIDAGGPAREIVTEAAIDLVSPTCGLFIPVPNARNEIGPNREFVIPIPDPRHKNVLKQYKFAGVLIGICIRSLIVQDLNIAPLVWNYLANGVLSISDIYEVDQNYKMLIDSLNDAMHSEMNEETFKQRFNLRFVVVDSRGQEIPLTQRGRTERVTLANCGEYISLSNEFRLGEMRPHLEAMRAGLWENFNFKPPAFVTGEMLDYSACGDKIISYETLKSIIKFEGLNSEQVDIFLRVLQAMTPEERSKFLKFSTGRKRLPARAAESDILIRVDSQTGPTDRLPTASTCFNQFHLPAYSSYDKAYQMITIAIDYTGTFENR